MIHIRKVLREVKFIKKECGLPGAGTQEERRGRQNGYRAGVLQMDHGGGDTIGNTLNAHELCSESGWDDTAPLQGSSAIYCIYSYSMYTPATRYLLLSFSCPFFFCIKKTHFCLFPSVLEVKNKRSQGVGGTVAARQGSTPEVGVGRAFPLGILPVSEPASPQQLLDMKQLLPDVLRQEVNP